MKIKSVAGYKPVCIRVPERGERILMKGMVTVSPSFHEFHEIIIERCECPDREYDVPVYGVPEGWRPVRFGYIEGEDYVIVPGGKIETWEEDHTSEDCLIVEPAKPTVPYFKPIAFRAAREGEYFLLNSVVHQCTEDSEYPKMVVEPIEVPVEVEVPEGYKPVRYGRPDSYDLWLSKDGKVVSDHSAYDRLILRKEWWVADESTCAKSQQARFRNQESEDWEEGTLEGVGVGSSGDVFFVDEVGGIFNYCEVRP